MNDLDFIKMANEKAARNLERGEYPCFCIIVKNGKIISQAASKTILDHAEILAMKSALKKFNTLKDCVLYTNIEPCLMCAKAIVYCQIKKVVYGTSHREYGNKKSFDILKKNGIANDVNVISGVEESDASKLLSIFLDKHV